MASVRLDRILLPRVMTRAAAMAAGFSRDQIDRRVRVGMWTRLATSVYCTAPPHEPRDLIRAGALHAAPLGMLTGLAALTVYGFAGLPTLERPTLLVPYEQGTRSTGLIAVRRASHLPAPCFVDGMALAPVERAVIDHAMTLRWRSDVRALIARSVQRHGCRPDGLDSALGQVATRGSKIVRAVIGEIAAGARSAPEAEAAELLVAGGVFRGGDLGFEQNASLAEWGLAYDGDFLWRVLRAVLEIDSKEYHFDDAEYDATLDRSTAIRARQLDTLHVTPRMIRTRPEVFVNRTRKWLAGRAELLGVPPPFTS